MPGADGANAEAPAVEGGPTPGPNDWKQVSAGGTHTCGIRVSGSLYCWGSNAAGQVGDGGAAVDHGAPVRLDGGSTDWASVAAGSGYTCARKTSGRLYCWGFDGTSQLGDGGAHADQSTPVEVAGAATDWASVNAGELHTCARKTTGDLYCWGFDNNGQVGVGGANASQVTPSPVSG